MSDTWALGLSWVAGTMLGAMFFGGLYWTVRRGMTSPRPAVWFVVSLPLRVSVAVAGMYVVAGGRWERLLACLVGFVMARLVVTWWTRPARPYRTRAREASHAP